LSSQRFLIPSLTALIVFASVLPGVTPDKKKRTKAAPARHTVMTNVALALPAGKVQAAARPQAVKTSGPWRVPTYADSTAGDFVEGDDRHGRSREIKRLGGD
jgi:hypothetical protein